MKRIYKYKLEVVEKQVVNIPSNVVLSADSQGLDIIVYALIDTDINNQEKQKYEFVVYGTGIDVNINIEEYKFLNTVKLNDGLLMFHVFYKAV